MPEIIFTAIVGGLPSAQLPLGGGATVINALVGEWAADKDFSLTILGIGSDKTQYPPNVAYEKIPLLWQNGGKPEDLTQLSALQYARIAQQFERETTDWLLARANIDGSTGVPACAENEITGGDACAASRKICVICNDISEGVDFRRVAKAGVPIVTIFNVDVVDFFTRFYLFSIARPETLTALHRAMKACGLSRLMPSVLRLVFEKQAECVRYSKRIVVPSTPMKEILLRCYPWKNPDEIVVVPWGAVSVAALLRSADSDSNDSALRRSAATTRQESDALRFQFKISDNDFVLLTLSRLSREKGLDALLKALLLWEKSGDRASEHVQLFICGEAAYMGGERYKRKLQQLAARLQRAKVHFVGHVDGARKQAFFELADLFVMPSYHESYGLTLVEAMRAGLPVLTSNHYSAAEIVGNMSGQIARWERQREAPLALKNALTRLLVNKQMLRQMGMTAKQSADEMRFSDAAAKIKKLVEDVISP
jgi:glycosyltransferase involved in cell wall biosynthesis